MLHSPCFTLNCSILQSQSHIVTDSQSVSKSWCLAPSGAHDQIFITLWQLRSCFCGAPSLTRGRISLLYKLLALARAVFLGYESLGIRDHILLSQIWDFPFRRILRLTGSRWRYSTPPPHGFAPSLWIHFSYNHFAQTQRKTQSVLLMKFVYSAVSWQWTHYCHALNCESIYWAVAYHWISVFVVTYWSGKAFTELFPTNEHPR
jgi:hypothetical protein